MNSYSIEIPNDKAGSYKIVTLFILIINVLVLVYLSFAGGDNKYFLLCCIGFVVNVFALTAVLAKRYFLFLKSLRIEIDFILSAIIWFILGKYLIALLLSMFAFIGLFTNRKLKIIFDGTGILYPSFPSKLFLWRDVAQVILKDDVLTIDLHNNQLLQFSLKAESLSHIDTNTFNQFCKSMATKANAV